MAYRDVADSFSFEIDRIDAAIAGGLVGVIQSGNLLQLWSIESVRNFGRLVGTSDLTVSWIVMLGGGGAFALLFAGIVSNFVQEFSTKVIVLSRKSDLLRKVLVPLLSFSALGITLSGIGIGYGILAGVLVYVLAMPAWIQFVMGGGTAFPFLDVVPVVLFAHYGALLGLVYGYLLEN